MNFYEIYDLITDYLHKRELYMNQTLTFNKYVI